MTTDPKIVAFYDECATKKWVPGADTTTLVIADRRSLVRTEHPIWIYPSKIVGARPSAEIGWQRQSVL